MDERSELAGMLALISSAVGNSGGSSSRRLRRLGSARTPTPEGYKRLCSEHYMALLRERERR